MAGGCPRQYMLAQSKRKRKKKGECMCYSESVSTRSRELWPGAHHSARQWLHCNHPTHPLPFSSEPESEPVNLPCSPKLIASRLIFVLSCVTKPNGYVQMLCLLPVTILCSPPRFQHKPFT